jgi:hypothetical protein
MWWKNDECDEKCDECDEKCEMFEYFELTYNVARNSNNVLKVNIFAEKIGNKMSIRLKNRNFSTNNNNYVSVLRYVLVETVHQGDQMSLRKNSTT